MKKPEQFKLLKKINQFTVSMIGLIFPFRGSTSSDFKTVSNAEHPFKPCPESPNCIIHSLEFDVPESDLFEAASQVFTELSPHKFSTNSLILQIEAVFRIPLFGFKDDVELSIASNTPGSILHIRSASRVGRSDLGVNRRRVRRILKAIQTKL